MSAFMRMSRRGRRREQASGGAGVGLEKVALGGFRRGGAGGSRLPRPFDAHELRVVPGQEGAEPVAGVYGEGVSQPMKGHNLDFVRL
jgi:hypothetical protein